jgi:tetratricopeptide (TPR) repeat protein
MRFLILVFLLIVSCAVKQESSDKANNWQYYYDLGMSSFMAKNYSEAIANFFRASQMASNEPKVWNALGLAYMEVQEYEKAENSFRKALQVDKSYTESKLNLGILYYRKLDYSNAHSVIKEVLNDEAFPQKHMAYYYLAKVNEAMGNREDYISNLRKAVSYNPMFLDAQLELAKAYEEEGRYVDAKRLYENLINNGIKSSTIHLNLARVEYGLKNYSLSKEHIKKVLEDRQTDPQTRNEALKLLSSVLIREQEDILGKKTSEESLPKPPMVPKEEEFQQPSKLYRIQLGTFSSEHYAKSWKDRLESELNLKDLVILVQSGLFRVLYGSFNSREEAQRELERLKKLNLYGFIVYD